MKRIIKIIALFFLSLTLVSCDVLNYGNDSSNKDKTIEEVVYIGENENYKEYLIYFTDGSSRLINITDSSAPKLDKITINDLYTEAKNNGFNGTIYDFINTFLDITIDESKDALVKGLRSSVSIFANFTKTEIKETPITGLPELEKKEYTSAGSGVIYKINKDLGTAYIITNHHVVFDLDSDTSNKISKDIEVYLYGLEIPDYKIKATYVGGSETNDVAVLKIENSNILKNSIATAAVFADSEEVEPGDVAIAIGNAEARGLSVTKGIISVESEHITMTTNDLGAVTFRVIRIDTAVNSGNSGGGLFNSNGEVIGIVNAKVIASNIDGIGYALPSNTVYNVADNIIYYCDNKNQEHGEKVLIGVTMKIVARDVTFNEEENKINIKDIIKVDAISENSPGSNHFIIGDEIVSVTIDDIVYRISKLHQMSDILFKVKRGDTITFKVLRDGNLVDLDITFTNENFNSII